jgi:hypothetical protein
MARHKLTNDHAGTLPGEANQGPVVVNRLNAYPARVAVEGGSAPAAMTGHVDPLGVHGDVVVVIGVPTVHPQKAPTQATDQE